MTKRDVLVAMSKVNFEDVTVGDVTVTAQDFYDYIDSAIETLDKRADAAAKRAADKKAAGDDLRAKIKTVIEEGDKTIADIVTALDDPDVTSAMVVARVSQLVKLGEIFKSDITVDGRKLKLYSVVAPEVDAE